MLIFGRPVLHVYLELDSHPYTVEKPTARLTRCNRVNDLIAFFLSDFFAVKSANFGSQKSLDSRHD